LDTSLVRFVGDIQKSLIWTRNYREIWALVEEPEEEINLADRGISCFILAEHG
jgi:hypothetical protein